MPGLSARSASKNMSRSAIKNARRINAVICGEVDGCEYGKVIRNCGNKTFIILDSNKKEHRAHIRGKITRINLNDVVLLSIRDYETRSNTASAVFDIMGVFPSRDVNRLIKEDVIPSWMASSNKDEDTSDDAFEFDCAEQSDEDSEEKPVDKPTKKTKQVVKFDDDVDIDAI